MKILYGIPSEGMGHATRSKVVIEWLIAQGHDLRIATSDRALALMNRHFPEQTLEIKGLHLAYDNGTVDKSASALAMLRALPEQISTNSEQFLRLHQEFQPDLVISDFESFSYYFAKSHNIPLLSIDNMQVINRCQLDLELPAERQSEFLMAKTIVKAKVPFCNHYLIASFFGAPPRKDNTTLVPPILRQEILNARAQATMGDHILVYQTATSQNDLIQGLQSLSQDQFLVYGFNRDENHGNVTLKSFSEAGFIHDLSHCKAVITNGGFSLISEAVYLHKPICSFPLAGQFEQWLNGFKVQECGYGRFFDSFGADAVKAFLYDLDFYQNRLSNYSQDGNQELFKQIQLVIDQIKPS